MVQSHLKHCQWSPLLPNNLSALQCFSAAVTRPQIPPSAFYRHWKDSQRPLVPSVTIEEISSGPHCRSRAIWNKARAPSLLPPHPSAPQVQPRAPCLYEAPSALHWSKWGPQNGHLVWKRRFCTLIFALGPSKSGFEPSEWGFDWKRGFGW